MWHPQKHCCTLLRVCKQLVKVDVVQHHGHRNRHDVREVFLAGNRIASGPFEYRGEQRYGGGVNHMQQPEPLLRTAVRDIGQEICVQAIEHGVDVPEERCAAPVVGV